MLDVSNELTDIDFRFVGLVRNPMDVMYSAWTRWRLSPEKFQHHWRHAYDNLARFHRLVGDRLVIVRYEDFASSKNTASELFTQLGIVAVRPGADAYIHGDARSRWKVDNTYGFQLDPAVRQTAASYGYSDGDLANIVRRSWPVRRTLMTMADRCVSRPAKGAKRRLRTLFRLRTS